MRDDQMMLGGDGDLDVVAHDTGVTAALRHRAGIRISQRYLLVRCGGHPRLECVRAIDSMALGRTAAEALDPAAARRRAKGTPAGNARSPWHAQSARRL